MGRAVDAGDKEELCQEEAEAEVGVHDPGLPWHRAAQGEGGDGHYQPHERHTHPDHRDNVESNVVLEHTHTHTN